MQREFRRPIILIIHSDKDFSLADRFLSELNYFAESGLVQILRWFISDRFLNQAENRRMLLSRMESANVILTLTSRNLLASNYYRQILRPQIREYRSSETKSLFSIILSPLNEDELGLVREYQSNQQLVFPNDGKSIFGEHLPEEMEGVFAEIVENIFLELINKFYRPKGFRVEQKQKVFISYSRTDYKTANIVRGFLSSQGYDVWMDKYSMKGGQNWVKSIDDGIRNSWALILLMSHASRASENVTYEWSFAFGANTCVVPVMIENVNLPSRLSWINYLNWYYLDISQYLWDELIDALDHAKFNASKGTCNT